MTLTPDAATAIAAAAQTDDEGVFSFPPLAPGVYELRLEAPGAQPVLKTIDASNEDVELDAIVLALGRFLCGTQSPAVRYKPSPPPQTLTESVCQIVQHPEQFNTTMTVAAPIKIAFEDFELSLAACDSRKIDAIWLEYGKGPKRQPTTWCCGDMVRRLARRCAERGVSQLPSLSHRTEKNKGLL